MLLIQRYQLVSIRLQLSKSSTNPMALPLVFYSLAVFLGMLLALECGHRMAGDSDPASADRGIHLVESFVLTLLGLLMAFNLNAANNHFESRQEHIEAEVHAIRSSIATFEALPLADLRAVKPILNEYLQTRRDYNLVLDKGTSMKEAYAPTQQGIRRLHNAVVRLPNTPEQKAALTAVENMAQAASDRFVIATSLRSWLMSATLVVLSLLSGVMVGRNLTGERRNQRWHRLLYAVLITSLLYINMDLGSPRAGLLRIDSVDRLFDELEI